MVFFVPAITYFPSTLRCKYLWRNRVSLLCSGWEEVVPRRCNHQIRLLLLDSGFRNEVHTLKLPQKKRDPMTASFLFNFQIAFVL